MCATADSNHSARDRSRKKEKMPLKGKIFSFLLFPRRSVGREKLCSVLDHICVRTDLTDAISSSSVRVRIKLRQWNWSFVLFGGIIDKWWSITWTTPTTTSRTSPLWTSGKGGNCQVSQCLTYLSIQGINVKYKIILFSKYSKCTREKNSRQPMIYF